MIEKPTVTLRKSGPRYEELHNLWGDDPIPVAGFIGSPNRGPNGVEEFFQVDIKRLTNAQRMKLIEFVSRKWGISQEQVRKDMEGEHGMPIRAVDVNPPAIPLAMFL